jgi:hypothetical protein
MANPILHAELAAFAADANGLSNPTVLSVGEAQGHGFYVDEKSIEGAMRALLGKSLSSYLKHDGAGKDRLGQEVGFLSGLYREGQKLKAKSFEYFDTFKKEAASTYGLLVEMAQKVPEQFGFSPVIEYNAVWVMGDGSEVSAALGEKAPAGAIREIPSARILGVRSADLVKRPAVNLLGLLSADQALEQTSTPPAVMSTVATLSVTDHEAKIAELSTVNTAALAAKDGEISALTSALAAKDTEHKAAMVKAVTDATAPLQAKLAEAETFDARKLGVAPVKLARIAALDAAMKAELPAPAAKDYDRWEQYTALLSESPEKAAKFKAAHLSK